MEELELKLSFDDFALYDPEQIRESIWRDLGRQHRLPEQHRVTTSLWGSALTHANLRVSNKLMASAPREVQARVGSLIVYHPVPLAESLRAQEQLVAVYLYDLMATRYPGVVQEKRSGYGKAPETELPRLFNIGGRVILDTRGVYSASQFAEAAGVAYGLEPGFEQLQKLYRMIMSWPNDSLRVVVGSVAPLDLPTGRLDFVRARPADFGRGEGGRVTREIERVVHGGGSIVVEGTAGEIDRFLEVHRDYKRHSKTCASRTV